MSDDMSTEQTEVEDFTDEQLEAPQDAQEPPQQDAEAPEQQEPEDEPEDDGKGGREAAKYRRRLRETEAERDALTERVQSLQKSVVDSIVTEGGMGGRMRSAEPFWAGGVDLADLLDEEGEVDRDKVLAACDDVCGRFNITRRPKPLTVPNEGSNPNPFPRQSMEDVVMGRTR